MFATRALTASGGVPGPAKENGIWALLRTHEDILEASDVGGIANLPKPDRRMLEIGEEIIEHQEGKFDPLTFKDRYEDAVRDVIARKKRGQKMTTAPPVEKDAGKVIDLIDALRRSLAGQGGGSKERAECFLERKKGKAVTKANPKPTNRAA
jgi:DNA end-binding protein Ku